MIGQLTGVIAGMRGGALVLDVSGVGYLLHTPASLLTGARVGDTKTFLTHLAVREDALDLYGFANAEDLSLFELLLRVSGIGPKTALAVMNLSDSATLRRAIAHGEAAYLTKVSGIGRKTAERLIVELRDKLGDVGEGTAAAQADVDVLEALTALGYGLKEARAALKRIPESAQGTQGRLREALKVLTGK